jgi:hypothetical protein
MENNNYPIINGSYDFTQVYLLYQLLNQLNLGNNHNENILNVLNQINGKNNNDIIAAIGNIPQVDLSNITNLLTSIKNKEYPTIPQADYSSIIAAIGNIPTTDLSGILAALYNIDNTLKYNNTTPDYSSIINAINNIKYNDSNVVNAINGIKTPEVDLKPVIDAINALKTNLNNEDINLYVNNIKTCPQKTITEVVYEPLPRQPKVNIVQKDVFITPPPKVNKIKIKEAYTRVCGTPNPSDYAQCVQCVDKWLSNNPNPELKQVTRSGTGCGKLKKY